MVFKETKGMQRLDYPPLHLYALPTKNQKSPTEQRMTTNPFP